MSPQAQTRKPRPRRPVGLVTGPEYLAHDPGANHPESPQRLLAIWEKLDASRLGEDLLRISPSPAKETDLLLAHDAAYVALARREIRARRPVLSTGDTEVCPRSYEVAVLAAGGCLSAVDAVCGGRVRSAFCAVRPPGHHANASTGMGFCIFNNAAIAARHAQKAFGLERVLIVDWDVHHGNGTQDIFYEDPSVFYFSIHQADHYPMPLTGKGHPGETGGGKAKGTNLNCPLPAGSGNQTVLAAIRNLLLPAVEKFRPELVIISAGFDCRQGDPLGSLIVTDEGIAGMTREVMGIARAAAAGRIVSILEGGYNLPGLASAAVTHLQTLME